MKLYVFDYGLFQVFENNRLIGLQGFLVQMVQNGEIQNILIDTGFPAWYADDIEAYSKRDNLHAFGRIVTMTHQHTPTGQLATIGLKPNDITHLVITHTHIDHVGGINDFPNAKIYISKTERALPRPLYFDGRSSVEWNLAREYYLLDGDVALNDKITLISTPGHSIGHYSVMVKLPKTGVVLIAADAINRLDEWENKTFSNPQALDSAQKLIDLHDRFGAMLIYGHDPAQWNTLKKAPLFYD
jgi:N-acyl homoserine lactone hydrolase